MNLLKTINTISIRSTFILINQISHLISIPILVTRLQVETFGQVAFCFVLIQFSWLLCDWGIQNYTIEKWGKMKKRNQQNMLIISIFCLNLFLAISISIVIFIFKLLNFINIPNLYFTYTLLSIIFGGIIPYWFFLVKKNLQEILIITLISRMIYLALIYFFVIKDEYAYIAISAQALSMFIIGLYSFYIIFSKYYYKFLKVKFNNVIFICKNSFPFLVNIFTFNQINVLWALGLSFFGSLESIALYNIADQIYKAGISFSKVVSQSIRIHFINSSFFDKKNTFQFFCFFYFIISILLIIIAGSFISNYFPEDYKKSINLIQIIIVICFLQSIINLIHYPLLADIKGHKWLNQITKLSLIAHLLGVLFWIIFFSESLSLSIIFLVVVFIHFIFYLINLKKFFYVL